MVANAREPAYTPEPEKLLLAASHVRWWPAAIAFLLIGAIYFVLPDQLTIGPAWLPLAVIVPVVAGAWIARWRGFLVARRYLVLGALALVNVAVTASAFFLVGTLLDRRTEAGSLLRDAALVWVSNVLIFSLLYWEIDGGGPAHRHAMGCESTDFVFPQRAVADADDRSKWMPDYLDYLFLAFNTSTAFSPTDTMVLARRAKVLMMWQSLVSLITIAVLAARAINTI